MEAEKRHRQLSRALFTKAHTAYTNTFGDSTVSVDDKIISFQMLELKMANLDEAHTAYNEALLASEEEQDKILKELEADDAYKVKFLAAKRQIEKLTAPPPLQPPSPGLSVNAAQVTPHVQASSVNTKKNLPKLGIPKFHGSVKEWLPFWSQFKKYHEDASLSNEEKFEYLLQATVAESRARGIVESFPPTNENYEKVVTTLKNRFGREDLVVEYYIRELLGLVLQNAVSSNKKEVTLSSLFDKLGSHLRALESLGVATDKCAAMLFPLVESSLPEEALRAWQRSAQSVSAETENDSGAPQNKDRLTLLLKFLQNEVENEERIDMAKKGFNVTTADQEQTKKQRNKTTEPSKDVPTCSALLTQKSGVSVRCIFCSGEHTSGKCASARKLSLSERKAIVKRENACFICLNPGHFTRKCKVRCMCEWCGGKHMLLMCTGLVNKESESSGAMKAESSDKRVTTESSLTTFSQQPEVYLETLRIKIYSDSKEIVVRAILDSASQRSYVRRAVAEELGYVSRGQQEVIHSLFGGVRSKSEQHEMFLIHVKDLNESFACNFVAMSQSVICDTIPRIETGSWMRELHGKNVSLSDAGSDSGQIDVLIGADVRGKLMTGRKYDLENGLSVFETRLGWTVTGKLPVQSQKSDATLVVTTMYVREADVADLWRLDVLGITDPVEKLEREVRDGRTRDFLMSTAKISEGGRYEVKLPWVEDHAPLPTNYEIARARLLKTVERLESKKLRGEYENIFDDWLAQGIIERVPFSEAGEQGHYLPHRPVIKEHGTTKMRPVFDASASVRGYPSLNNCVEKGPNLIELVPAVLNRFREGEIGVTSDIAKAFLQISIQQEDRDFLRFLWMKEGEIAVFRHCRVVFGLACSPFMLAAILELHLSSVLSHLVDKTREFDSICSTETIERLMQSFYVDNCVASVNSQEELAVFVREAKAIMLKGGFDLRGWESTGDGTISSKSLVLGLLWDKERDTISINPALLKSDLPGKITKRQILSSTHKIFDPIGFTCPISVQPKLILRKLWEEKSDWDGEIASELDQTFRDWLVELPHLTEIEIPRCFGQGRLTLHAFSDGSISAYSAVVFARIEGVEGVKVHLISAKSRVASGKITIPRMELLGACIAARMTSGVVQSMTREILGVTYWSDSTTVLAWVKRDMQWGTFVWNRVKEIRSISKVESWRHVPGELNPADLPSRGCSPLQLVQSQWWLGPEWLYRPESEWPCSSPEIDEEEVRGEVKKSAIIHLSNVESRVFYVEKYFSSYTQLIRFSAWVHRFLENRKRELKRRRANEKGGGRKLPKIQYSPPDERHRLCLSFMEIREAEVRLLKHLQSRMFGEVDGKLSSFKTLVNTEGLIVVKTKILNRVDEPTFLCPILLSSNHEIVSLLIRETHEKLGHTGVVTVMSHLRDKFWITSLRKKLRSIISKCVVCKRQAVKNMQCETPPLPLDRVRDAAVFETTGVDFAGPLFLKGGEKSWVCIFTCAVYRAVHFELATSLSAAEFLECLRRFIARRGRPSLCYSDNGTNFTGTKSAFDELNWSEIIKYSSALRIEWVFNPPSAPWWGGWWERLIGILKPILRKVLGRACLTYPGLNTVLCDAESVINERPLTYISEDPNDPKPLTPAMFLRELPEGGVPDCDVVCNTKLNLKLKHRQKIREALRSRFRSEYLGQLALSNVKADHREVRIGDVVLIGDDTGKKRIDWPLARVVDIIPGRDGVNRVFILKTAKGLLKRALQRIFPLEISRQSELTGVLAGKLRGIESQRGSGETNFVNASEDNTLVKPNEPIAEVETNVKTRSGRTVKKPGRYISKE